MTVLGWLIGREGLAFLQLLQIQFLDEAVSSNLAPKSTLKSLMSAPARFFANTSTGLLKITFWVDLWRRPLRQVSSIVFERKIQTDFSGEMFLKSLSLKQQVHNQRKT